MSNKLLVNEKIHPVEQSIVKKGGFYLRINNLLSCLETELVGHYIVQMNVFSGIS